MPPLRAVSLAPSNTEIVFALGAQEQLLAVSSYCDFPEVAKKLPRLAGWSSIKAKDVLALKPELVLSSSLCQEALQQELAAAGLKVVHLDPRSLKDVASSFETIGGLLGKDGKALAKKFLSDLEALRPAEGSPRTRVYVEEWHQPPMVAGNWVPELLRLVGAEPFNRELGAPSVELSWEELMEFDPELVIHSICGRALDFDPAEFLKVEGWNQLSAAKSGRIFSVDDSLFNRPGPRLVEGARLLRDLIGNLGASPAGGNQWRKVSV
jgi:iron complex transport system substrate-binding protein